MGELGPYDHGTFHYHQAERLEEEAKRLLKPAAEIVRGAGEAMDLGTSDLNWNLVDTLKDPPRVSFRQKRAQKSAKWSAGSSLSTE